MNAVKIAPLALGCLLACGPAFAVEPGVEQYDVVWTSPSKDAAGSMPLGNGEVGINLWAEENGSLVFYISRTDSVSEIDRLLKVGKVRVELSPNPFAAGTSFRQELKLRDGVCEIQAGGTVLHLFVDSERPVIHVSGSSREPLTVRARVESWREQPHTLAKGDEQGSAWSVSGAPFDLVESADVFVPGLQDAVAWYHRNETNTAFTATMQVQSLDGVRDTVRDPLLHRTFGGWVSGEGFVVSDSRTLTTPKPVTAFELRVAAPCAQTSTAREWLDQARSLSVKDAQAEKRTSQWWHEFWERSWVFAESGLLTVPGQTHPLRVGVDSQGGNRFPGQIDRTNVVWTNGLTLEAWIKPETLTPGRIFDKITAGGRDGFLLDTHPGDTLRFIVGNSELDGPSGLLKTGVWQHVKAGFDTATGGLWIELEGRRVASSTDGRLSPGKAYTLQRYVQACAGRGAYPIKFNGGIFTVEPKAMGRPFNPDWRAWGNAHWYQNVRHMYHPMLASGDYEMMRPFFALYENARPLAEARTRFYHGAEGAYFPETMTLWGTYANPDYGWNRVGFAPKDVQSPWWRYAWNQGPELVAVMLDYWNYTRDETFARQELLPMAVSVLKYFDTRFKKDAEGRVILDPAQSVETFWHEVINDQPTTAGLNDITTRLCALPNGLASAGQQAFFQKMKAACPQIPIEDGRLAPAAHYKNERSNCENPELYAIWPFRLYGLGRPGLEIARAAYAKRANHLDNGWGYDGTCAALLGLTDEAARILAGKCANSHPAYRWPATWGPNFDWLPDQNHGGNLLEITQAMLLQPDGDKLRLLPAWPRDWNVRFKLRAPGNTIVECTYKNGQIERLNVEPASRLKDVIRPEEVEK
jgi:hypothetical protein